MTPSLSNTLTLIVLTALILPFLVMWLLDRSAARDERDRAERAKATHIDYLYQVGSDGPIYHIRYADGRETWTADRDAAPHKTRPNARINRGLRMYSPSIQQMSAIADEFGRVPTAEEAAAKFNSNDWRHE